MDARKIVREQVILEGQPYVDDPIVVKPKPGTAPNLLERSVAEALGSEVRKAPVPVTVGHERVKLRWMVPDGKGGLKPKHPQKDGK